MKLSLKANDKLKIFSKHLCGKISFYLVEPHGTAIVVGQNVLSISNVISLNLILQNFAHEQKHVKKEKMPSFAFKALTHSGEPQFL